MGAEMVRGAWRRWGAAALAWVLGPAGLMVIGGSERAETADRPGWVAALEHAAAGAPPAPVPWRGSTSAPLLASVGAPPARVTWPEPARWDVTLGTPGSGEGRPVRLEAAAQAAAPAAAPRGTLRVEVLDRAAARRAGASGFVFTVSGAPAGLRARLSIDYSGFADAYGAGYADRLRLVKLPGGERMPSHNDRSARTLTADGVEAAGTFAVISDVGGEEGTFAATPLSMTGSWQVAPGSGAFGYTYPIDVPDPAGGTAPSVSLGYSSAAVDGLTSARNPQAGPSGLGWSDFANGFIERQYEPCIHTVKTTDLCWLTDNATISLAGISGPLLPVNAQRTQWRVQSDPGWRIERLTGAPFTDIYQQQYWKVTGPDGTQYFFGFGHMPGRPTNATLGVPVLADNTGEPCRAAGDKVGGCNQGWRWYLDRVVDPDGNVQSLVYEREENWYSSIGGLAGNARYHRGALLKEIYYGGRDWDAGNYAARVTFGHQWRCVFLVPECPAPVAGNTAGFPDVPVDLICEQASACTVKAPSFFHGRRYSHVLTEVKVGGAWKLVAQHNIYASFGDGLNSVARKLQVVALQHAGVAFGKLSAYPSTTFEYQWKDNRADHGGQPPKAMRHNRLSRVTNPAGGTVTVTYGQNRSCESYNPAPRWDENVRDCFPQPVKEGTFTRTALFNKYLVTRVVESPGQGSPDMTTSYLYEGDPAWAFDTGAFARDEDEIGWTIWRGYGTVTVTKGVAKTRMRVFRGWHEDWKLVQDAGGRLIPEHGRRSVPVSTFDGALSYPDHPALAGRLLEEQRLGTLGGVAGSILESRRHEYHRVTTFDPGPDFLFKAEWVGLASTTETVYSAPTAFRQRRSQTTYNANLQPATTLEEGWLDVTGDERCSITTYADHLGAAMVVYPASNRKVAGSCSSTTVLSLSETSYDSRGNPVRQRTAVEAGRWSETTTEYDALGRPVRVTDPVGATTTTTYEVTAGAPVTQIPVRTSVTNALGHTEVSDLHPEFGVAHRRQDANGAVTSFGYDEFGRLETVWLPTEPIAFLEPSYRFAYDIPNRAILTRRLVSESRCCTGVVFEDAWTVHDGFWRERQEQGLSPAAGKVLVSETTYDDRGLVREETVEQAVTGTPGRYLGGTSWLNRTRHGYDELGREVRKEWWRGAAVAHATTTSYGLDTVTVTGPDGRQVRSRVDGLGRTVAVEEFDGQGWVSSGYRYDLADRLLSVTDPAGNRITYTVNQAGWRTAQQDPDRGSATFTYDNAGRQIAVDAAGNRVHTVNDALGRTVERRAGSATGTPLATWAYDTAPGGKGRPHRETTHTPTGTWVSEVVGYDAKGRSTGSRLVVPAGIPGLSGTYTVTQAYDRADRVVSTTYPAIGGLPQETVTTGYDALGLPTRLAGLDEYVWGATYDDRGRRASAGLGPRPGGATWMAKTWMYNVDQRIAGAETFVTGAGVVSDHELVFDPAGNLAESLTRLNGLAWRECFRYDPRSRLTAAHTVATSTSCVDGTPGTGDRPYVNGYRYAPDGRLLERVESGVSTAYTYPAAGSARPHAPTRVGADTYTWDARGNLSTRAGQTFSWDVQGMLSAVTGSAGATTFVYDPSGQRLLRRTPDGRATLYFAGHEVTSNGTATTAVRSYTFDGELVATRTAASGVEYLVTDAAGSVELAVPAGGTVPSATRAYEPFGQVRAQTGDTATDRGFVGQIEDASTGLSYLNARYYDTATGIFLSTDPVYDTAKPKTLNPYSYSLNNPTTFADPGGMYSSYTFGLELENANLKGVIRDLRAEIGRLHNVIEEQQDIIRKQQKQIDELISHVEALEAEIARQASIIRQLEARIRYLEGVVAAQQREISRLKRQIAYYKRVIVTLVVRNYHPKLRGYVLGSIFSGRGVPNVGNGYGKSGRRGASWTKSGWSSGGKAMNATGRRFYGWSGRGGDDEHSGNCPFLDVACYAYKATCYASPNAERCFAEASENVRDARERQSREPQRRCSVWEEVLLWTLDTAMTPRGGVGQGNTLTPSIRGMACDPVLPAPQEMA